MKAKQVRGETPKDRALKDRIARARAANPPRGAEWYEKAAELAEETGADVADVLDMFDERAAIREYDGATDRATSEAEAFGEVEELFRRQRRLL